MKREILFRGFNNKHKEWRYGYYFVNRDQHFIVEDKIETNPLLSEEDFAVIPDTIGQYTGLKDKNGKKIFERDIIKLKDFDVFDEEYKEIKGVVEYSVDRFIIVAGKIECDLSVYYDTKCKIIGNTTDTPELMK